MHDFTYSESIKRTRADASCTMRKVPGVRTILIPTATFGELYRTVCVNIHGRMLWFTRPKHTKIMHRNRPSIHTQARIIVAQLGDSLWRTVRVRGRKIRGLQNVTSSAATSFMIPIRQATPDARRRCFCIYRTLGLDWAHVTVILTNLSFAAIGLQYREEPGRSKWYVVSERGGYGLSPTAVRRRRGAYPTREKLNCER